MEFHAIDPAKISTAILENVNSIAMNLAVLFVLFVVIGGIVYLVRAKSRSEKLSLEGALKFIFPTRVFLHRSAVLDYLNLPIWVSVRVLFTLTVTIGTALASLEWLRESFGFYSTLQAGWLAFGLQFLIIWLIAEFATFINHYMFHMVPFFWRFHRVHHSSESLTPITAFRFHPFEMFISLMVTGWGGGMLTGLALYLSGLPCRPQDVGFALLILSIVHVVLEPFYHSHIWISYGKTLNRFFLAPCHHWVHHSTIREHWDKNMGDRLALWDYLFGTLYVPQYHEKFPPGINDDEIRERNPHPNVVRMLVEPLVTASQMAARGIRRLMGADAHQRTDSQQNPTAK